MEADHGQHGDRPQPVECGNPLKPAHRPIITIQGLPGARRTARPDSRNRRVRSTVEVGYPNVWRETAPQQDSAREESVFDPK
jgi:hypothetical protein